MPQQLPWTPDFDEWRVTHKITAATIEGDAVHIEWEDGRHSRHHALLLRENSPDEQTIHPLSREMRLSPHDLPEDTRPHQARITPHGALEIVWAPDNHTSRYHPGWLRAHAWLQDTQNTPEAPPHLWHAATLPEPPTFDGPTALKDPTIFLAWLQALSAHGVARLAGLPQQDGLLEQTVQRIGVIRESNFGRTYTLAIKDDPDSNAYTAEPLPPHIDLPTRECPPGLQFLYCRANSTTGGEGTYADGYQIAADIQREQPDHYHSLATDNWEYNNRAKTSAYRATGVVIKTDAHGAPTEIRYNPWLRAPMRAPLHIQARAYRAYRAFAARAQSPRYQMTLTYRAGDLLAFDNRRILHGRRGYSAAGGERFIEGVYSDRDELHSRIRLLKRQAAAAQPA